MVQINPHLIPNLILNSNSSSNPILNNNNNPDYKRVNNNYHLNINYHLNQKVNHKFAII